MRRLLRRAGVLALVLLFLAGVAALASLGDGGESRGPTASTPATTTAALPPARSARTVRELQPERVLARVEALRGLRLRRPPRFVVLTPEQARRQVQAAEDREAGGAVTAREEAVNLSLVTLLGLLPPDVDLDDLAGRITSQGTLGYYDGAKNEMTIISKGPDLPVGVETTVAHELTHAIDDEHFDVFDRVQRLREDGDAELAYRSVVEGNASEVEERYRQRYRIPQPAPGGDAEQRELLRDLPFGLQLQLGFPYAIGQTFVDALRSSGADGQALLARALGSGRPRTTVEILDPTRWVRRQPVVPTPLRPGPILGDGWTRIDGDSIGASDVLAILAPVESEAGSAALVARAWTGGEYRFYRRGGAAARGCEDPCQSRDAVVGGVAFAAAPDAKAFATQFGRVLEQHRDATRAGTAVWRVGDGAAAVGVDGARATFAYAPTPELAIRLVREAPAA
ncbi:hypothetical protein [Patulibacter sp.]|uniref:hypothetical protein n=1 Tax=Patulibacter sp. TaxID=1912859 RepID=UPI00271AF209|nr:hypothetical protein [Patulibacter sp.]MDO9406987.1 hypothetical protein [Patulibacter sp.]